MDVEKLKQRIKMKETFETEIRETLEEIGEKAVEILVKNDEIFNSTQVTPTIFNDHISFTLPCDVDYTVLEELNRELKPSRMILSGGGYSSGYITGGSDYGYMLLKLYFK